MGESDTHPAEQRLLEALRMDGVCDLIPGNLVPDRDDILGWDDPDRVIRFETLRSLLLRVHPELRPRSIRLRGAIITGGIELQGAVIDPALVLEKCRVDDRADFRQATFTATASFEGSVFSGPASFEGGRFFGDASFRGVRFTGQSHFADIRFLGLATFDGASFTEDAGFGSASFFSETAFRAVNVGGDAVFDRARFHRDVEFTGSTFKKSCRFDWARFSGLGFFREIRCESKVDFEWARFEHHTMWENSSFAGELQFGGAVFEKGANFVQSIFADHTRFDGVTFDDATNFNSAQFKREADFRGALARSIDFSKVEFHTPQLGPMAAETILLKEAVFHRRILLVAKCSTLSAINMQVRDGGQLQIHSATIDAEDSEFIGRTILTDPGPDGFADWDSRDGFPGSHLQTGSPARDKQISEVSSRPSTQSTVTSLVRTNVTDLTLADIDLSACRFHGAHGLDRLRIDSTFELHSTPTYFAVRRPLRFTKRRVIAEEVRWRCQNASWDGRTPEPCEELPSATEIAGIYRGLRKGLEDSSNGPGAADFYYGEMEMRRLSGREKGPKSSAAARSERCLLTAYWAVSGYGLRAWRAFTAFASLILIAAAIFTFWGLAQPPQTSAKAESVDLQTGVITYPPAEASVDGFGRALELAARNSVALLKNPGIVEMTAVGTVADIILRLLGPVLIGLALLALRGRMKR